MLQVPTGKFKLLWSLLSQTFHLQCYDVFSYEEKSWILSSLLTCGMIAASSTKWSVENVSTPFIMPWTSLFYGSVGECEWYLRFFLLRCFLGFDKRDPVNKNKQLVTACTWNPIFFVKLMMKSRSKLCLLFWCVIFTFAYCLLCGTVPLAWKARQKLSSTFNTVLYSL